MALSAMLESLRAHLAPGRAVRVFVIHDGVPAEIRARVGRDWPDRLAIEWLQVDDMQFADAPLWGQMSVATYYRLAIADLLPASLAKVLWLDSDLIITTDLGRLWDLDVTPHHLLAAQDAVVPLVSSPCGVARYDAFGIPASAPYFNAGVMLVNLARWREDAIARRALDYVTDHRDDVYFFDQEGLNAAVAGKWGALDPRWNWNVSVPAGRHPHRGAATVPARGGDLPWIVHFAGTQKPWLVESGDRFGRLYYHYLDMTAWAGWRPRASWRRKLAMAYGRSPIRRSWYPAELWGLRLLRRVSRKRQRSLS